MTFSGIHFAAMPQRYIAEGFQPMGRT